MQDVDRKSIDRRLARIEGQVRGLRRMVEEDAYCCDILNQIAAVSSALSQAAASVASQHMRHCVLGHGSEAGHDRSKNMTQEELMEELSEVLAKLVKA